MASQLEAGSKCSLGTALTASSSSLAIAVWVNEIHMYNPLIPFGGVKQSGLGVENGYAGLSGYTNYQTLSISKTIPNFGS